MLQNTINVREQEPALAATGIAVRYFHQYTSPTLEQHGHDIIEMNFIVEGTGSHLLQDVTFPIGPGTMGITHYGCIHGYRTDGRGLNLYNIYLDPLRHPLPDIGPELRHRLPRLAPLHPELAHTRNRVLHIAFPNPGLLIGILKAMARETDLREPGYREALRAGYQLFMTACARRLARQEPVMPTDLTPAAAAIEKLRTHIDASFTEPLTLDGLARRAGLAPTYVCRVFKRHTGKTVVQYLTQRRVEAAMLLLSTTNEKVLSIALESGFNDLAHFNRTFRKTVGTTPGGYRKKIKNTS